MTKKNIIPNKNKKYTRKCKTTFTNCISKRNIKYNQKPYLFSELFIKLLISIGLKSAIGIPGSELFKLYQSMISNNIDVILSRNEMTASFAPIGATRVCMNRNDIDRNFCLAFASDGPGALNLSNGVAQAMVQNIPCIYIINRNVNDDNNNRIIQQIDTPSMYKNISKSIIEIDKKYIKQNNIIDKIYDALLLAFSYPQGPIVFFLNGDCFDLDIFTIYKIEQLNFYITKFSNMFKSKNGYEISNSIIGADYTTGLYSSNWENKLKIFKKENKKKIIGEYKNFLEKLIENSKKPVFLFGAGSGIFLFNNLFINICRKLHIPYLLTTQMKQIADNNDIFYAESTGHCGTYCGNMTIANADLLICFGTSFNLYMTIDLLEPFKNIKNIVSVNINPELYKTQFVNYYIIDDAKKVITSIDVDNINMNMNERNKWISQIQEYKKIGLNKLDYFFSKNDNEILKQGDIYNVIQYHVDIFNNTNNKKYIYFVVDAGSSQLYSTSLLNFRKKYQLITSLKWGAIGDGLGLLIGAALNNPDDLFILISGDGGTMLSLGDYITIKEANLKNIIIIIIENGGLALVSEASLEVSSKTLEYGNGYKRYPNWLNLFNGLNLNASISKTKNEFNKSFENAIKKTLFNETIVIIAVVSMDIYYAPIVPIGTSSNKMKYLYYNDNIKIDNCRIANLH